MVGVLPAATVRPCAAKQSSSSRPALSSSFLGGSAKQQKVAAFISAGSQQQQRRVTVMAAKGAWMQLVAPGQPMRVGQEERHLACGAAGLFVRAWLPLSAMQ